jgi:hypothetical protein
VLVREFGAWVAFDRGDDGAASTLVALVREDLEVY